MEINWSLLGQPVNVGAAVQAGFERGATRSAFADLARDPTNESALSRLAMFDPQSAMQMRETARAERLRTGLRSAFDPATGNIDPVAARTAYAEAGDIPGALEFDRNRAATQQQQQAAEMERRRRAAHLLETATDQATYAQNRELAIRELGVDASAIPETYDPAWVAQQRRLHEVLSDDGEMSAFTREAELAGIRPGSPEYRQLFTQRYTQPRIVTDPATGALVVVGGGGTAPQEQTATNPQTGERVRLNPQNGQWEPIQGGAGQPGPQTFP